MAMQKRTGGVEVLGKAVHVIKACNRLGGNVSLGDIARETGLPRSTVQRIVKTLVQEGFMAAGEKSSSISLGPDLLGLGASAVTDIVEKTKPFIEKLSQVTSETVDLSRLNRDHAVFMNQVQGSQRLLAVSSVGQSFPLHCSSHGKAMLALLSDVQAKEALRAGLKAYTRNSITSFQVLRKELGEIRRNGLAEDNEEYSIGISAVAMAFTAATGQIYAVSIPIPTVRFKDRKKSCSLLLRQCVQHLNEHLSR